MIEMMLVEDEDEAAMVERIFNEIRKTLDEGRSYRDARCFDEAAFFDGRGEAFFLGELVRIPYGALVYVYRNVGNGEAVYDVYSFGYMSQVTVEKDVEGDLAGLVNLGGEFFPF